MKKTKLIICLLLITVWMGIIFLFSNMDSNSSNDKSKGVIDQTIELLQETGIIDDLTETEKKELVNKLNMPLRKCMHVSVYFVLAILIVVLLKKINIKILNPFLLTIIICFIYACADEYHQTFIGGRTGQLSDVIIDITGSIIALIIYKIFSTTKEKASN